jgi:hypothetical protein
LFKITTLVSIVILLLSTSAYAVNKHDWISAQQNNIVDACKDGHEDIFEDVFWTASECALVEFHALHNVIKFIDSLDRKSKDYAVFSKIMQKHILEEFNTFDFMAAHLEFEKYLEEKAASWNRTLDVLKRFKGEEL